MHGQPSFPTDRQAERTIIIGDVHGCPDELMKLLAKAESTKSDEILCVGDLISKGPDSRSVMEWAMGTPNVSSVLGNHEARFLDRWLDGKTPKPDTPDFKTYLQLGDLYQPSMEFIKSWPLFLRRESFFVVHAGVDPRISSLEEQSRNDLLTIRVPEGMKTPWYESYQGDLPAVFGHWSKNEPVICANAIGLDTGCVYGGALTALILPERRLISVPAKRDYRK